MTYNTNYLGLRLVPSKYLARDISGSVWNDLSHFYANVESIEKNKIN